MGRLIQRRMAWVCNLLPPELFEGGYQIPPQNEDDAHTISMNNNESNNDIIFDTSTIPTT